MKKETFSTDPVIQAAQEKQKRKKTIKIILTILSFVVILVGVTLIIIGALSEITNCIIVGVVISVIGLVPLILVGIAYYDISL